METDLKLLKGKEILIRWNEKFDRNKNGYAICEKFVLDVSPNETCLKLKDDACSRHDIIFAYWHHKEEFEIIDVLQVLKE